MKERETKLELHLDDSGLGVKDLKHCCLLCWNYDVEKEYCEKIMDPIFNPTNTTECSNYSPILSIDHNIQILKDRGIIFPNEV